MPSLYSRTHNSILAVCLLAMFTAGWVINPSIVNAAKSDEPGSEFPLQSFLEMEIEGISLTTPPEKIPAQLAAASYEQIGDSIFIKETPLPGGRKSTYRIEVENTAQSRSITYVRSEIGGRNKSPVVKNRPIPANEAAWAKTLYELACLNVSEEIKSARACEPSRDWHMRFGEGGLVNLSEKASAQLSASGPSTILGITHLKD